MGISSLGVSLKVGRSSSRPTLGIVQKGIARMKLSEALEEFWLEKARNVSKHTVADYKGTFSKFSKFLGEDSEVEQITTRDIRRFLNYLVHDKELSPHTVCNAWVALSSFWTWADIELDIRHIMRGRIKQPKVMKRKVKPFTQSDIVSLLEATEHTKEWATRNGNTARNRRPSAQRERAIILTLLDTGLRASELCDLTVDDFDVKRRMLHVRHGKGDKERYVMVGNRTTEAVVQYLATRGKLKPTAPLFSVRGEHHMDRANLGRLVRLIGHGAGVPNTHPHRFRHTFAITFLRNGGKMLVLKELLGHSDLQMVTHYVAIVEQDIEGSVIYSPADNWEL
jgi:integrase/recombinase XerD